MGPWVLDFYCPDAKLVVEVDGWGHNMGDQPARDDRRDAWLTACGLTVVRVTAAEVMADADGVEDGLIRQAAALGQPPRHGADAPRHLPRYRRGGGMYLAVQETPQLS